MRKIIVTCDKCGVSGDEDELQVKKVQVYVGMPPYEHGQYVTGNDWCEKCLIEMNLISPDKKSAEKYKKLQPSTIENTIKWIQRKEDGKECLK